MASRYLRTSRHPPTVNGRLAVAEAAPVGQNGSSLKVASGGSGVLAKKRTLKLSSTAAAPLYVPPPPPRRSSIPSLPYSI